MNEPWPGSLCNISFKESQMLKLSVFLLIFVSSFLHAQQNAGKTIVARGQVDATNEMDSRQLKRRSPVFLEDKVTTGQKSNTQLRMIDGGLLSLQQESVLVVNEYRFNQQDNDDSVSLELIKGGLRTITGALAKGNDNYKLQTPVASIGVRGTHYETELLEGDLYLAVWDGVIDVAVTVGNKPKTFSLGDGQDFQFAIVRANGEVEFSLSIPALFAQGHSEDLLADSQRNIESMTSVAHEIQQRPLYEQSDITLTDTELSGEFDISGASLLDNDDFWTINEPTAPDVIAARSGEFTFNQLAEHSFSSSVGELSDIAMSMTVDFDLSRVSTGQLSFTDAQGEWFAVFNGVIGAQQLELNINFASHGNNLADGLINSFLVNNASEIFGNIQLTEIGDSSIFAGGNFLLQQP